jgi:HrpA-like RNA helicase
VFKEHPNLIDEGNLTKIVLSTTIAECSVTINGIKIVIDCG